jgi:hypothetical protein
VKLSKKSEGIDSCSSHPIMRGPSRELAGRRVNEAILSRGAPMRGLSGTGTQHGL